MRSRTLTTLVTPQPLHLVKWCKQVVALFDLQHVTVSITVGAENGSSVRRFTVQVINRLQTEVHAQCPVRFTVGTADTGVPAGSQTLSVATGATVATVSANQCLDLVTDTTGKAEVDVTVTGAATRYVRVSIGAESVSTGAVAWV